MAFADYASTRILQHLVGRTSYTMPSTWLALFTAVGSDAGTGFTEVSGGAYARPSTASLWNAAAAGAPAASSISNSGTISFPAATANWGTVVGWGLYDAVTAGNLLFWDFMGNFAWAPFTATLASPGVITSTAHGYSNGDSLIVTAEYGGTLPTLSQGTWVGALTTASVTADTFTLASSGTALNTSSSGDGQLRKILPQIINSGVTASFAASTLTISLA